MWASGNDAGFFLNPPFFLIPIAKSRQISVVTLRNKRVVKEILLPQAHQILLRVHQLPLMKISVLLAPCHKVVTIGYL